MEFESVADKLVTHLYDQFDRDTIQLDRDQDENVFLQTSARYTYTLQQHLNMCALELIEKNKHSITDIFHIQQILTKRIAAYVNEFSQKSKQ